MQSDSKKVLDGDHLDLPPAKDKNNSGKKCIGKKFPLTIKIKGSQLNTCFLSDLAINSVFFFSKTTSTIPFHSPHLSLFTALFLPNFSCVLTAFLSSKTIKQCQIILIYWLILVGFKLLQVKSTQILRRVYYCSVKSLHYPDLVRPKIAPKHESKLL